MVNTVGTVSRGDIDKKNDWIFKSKLKDVVKLSIGLFSPKKKLHWRHLGRGRCRIYVRIRIILTDSDPAPTFYPGMIRFVLL